MTLDNTTSTAPTVQPPTLSGSIVEYLRSHKLNHDYMVSKGVRFEGDTICYPRRTITGVLGWKKHDTSTGRRWNEPSGFRHSETVPLSVGRGAMSGTVFVCEGESDAFCLSYWFGVTVLVVPGATAFPSQWTKHLLKYGRVIVIPDNDKAGEKLVSNVAAAYPKALIARLPSEYKDICEWLDTSMQYEDLKNLIDSASYYIPDHKIKKKYKQVERSNTSSRDILSVIGEVVTLRRSGSEHSGLCPFHEEKTPSFFVNSKKNLWYCHGCDTGGDAISFVMKYRGVSYRDALNIIGG